MSTTTRTPMIERKQSLTPQFVFKADPSENGGLCRADCRQKRRFQLAWPVVGLILLLLASLLAPIFPNDFGGP